MLQAGPVVVLKPHINQWGGCFDGTPRGAFRAASMLQAAAAVQMWSSGLLLRCSISIGKCRKTGHSGNACAPTGAPCPLPTAGEGAPTRAPPFIAARPPGASEAAFAPDLAVLPACADDGEEFRGIGARPQEKNKDAAKMSAVVVRFPGLYPAFFPTPCAGRDARWSTA